MLSMRNTLLIRSHYVGTLVREGGLKYYDWKVNEFAVDHDKILHWDLKGDIQLLGYNIKKAVDLFFVDEEGTFEANLL